MSRRTPRPLAWLTADVPAARGGEGRAVPRLAGAGCAVPLQIGNANEKTTFADAFVMADQVLYSGVGCITDLMVKEGLINLDFADVRAVMREMGKAMMGTGEATGEKRASHAAEAAIANPLINDVSMKGARALLISIAGGKDLTLFEVDEAATRSGRRPIPTPTSSSVRPSTRAWTG